MLGWIRRAHAKRLRRLDLEVLWPTLKADAEEALEGRPADERLAYARIAFATHALTDPAWLSLGVAEIDRTIEALD
jgi:hypothetical protein